MTVHVVLFRPKPDLSAEERDGLLGAIREAAAEVPSVRRFVIGERLNQRPQYVLPGFPDFPYVALIEFEDEEGLWAYLEHPAHTELGRRFNEAAEAALIYDFSVTPA